MKQKRVLIASFVLIFIGLSFMLNVEGNITGAVVGTPKSALNSTSSILFGFFLIWIAGIFLVGSSSKQEKPNMDEIIQHSSDKAVTAEKLIEDLEGIEKHKKSSKGKVLGSLYKYLFKLGLEEPGELDEEPDESKKAEQKLYIGTMVYDDMFLKYLESRGGSKKVEEYQEAKKKDKFIITGEIEASFRNATGITKEDEFAIKSEPSLDNILGISEKYSKTDAETLKRYREDSIKNIRDYTQIISDVGKAVGKKLDAKKLIGVLLQNPKVLYELLEFYKSGKRVDQFAKEYGLP